MITQNRALTVSNNNMKTKQTITETVHIVTELTLGAVSARCRFYNRFAQ